MTTTLHVKTLGKGEPLVLLHGWGWHSGIWQPLVPVLSEHYQLFLLDLPGAGLSPLTSEYSFENIAQQIFEIVPAQANWLGWSLGGLLAWWVALRYPQKILKLITVAASPCFSQKENWPGLSAATLEKFANSLTQNYEQTMLDFLILQLRGNAKNQNLHTELRQQIFSVKKPPLDALLGGLRLLATTDLRAELARLQCPSLHIFGSLDRIVPVEVVPQIQELLPHGQCQIIPHSGHIPFLSQPELFIELIT
jgi:pimeloyl-[acyl-carrier protein] methyl ester esterase